LPFLIADARQQGAGVKVERPEQVRTNDLDAGEERRTLAAKEGQRIRRSPPRVDEVDAGARLQSHVPGFLGRPIGGQSFLRRAAGGME
jgi:hypothetical protein